MTNLHRRFIRLAATGLAGAVVLSGCLPSPLVVPGAVGGRPILFIGNSLTFYNELPSIVQGLADAAGGDSLAVSMYATGNAALIDHWNNGGARAEIERQKWDFVVLQQGPSSVESNRDTLRLAAKLFEPSITKSGAKAVLFSAWPAVDRRQDFPRAIESYRLAAEDVGGLFAPVASAWLAAWNRDPSLSLYFPDGLHPSVNGSYLAALVLYSRILGKNPIGLPATFPLRDGRLIVMNAATATLLQEAAWEAVNGAPP